MNKFDSGRSAKEEDPYIYERTFPRHHVEGWMRWGVFPPPLHGAYNWPRSVHFVLATHDLWEPDGPPLDCTDEEGVERQQRACEAMLAAAREKYAGQDPIVLEP
jgi:hypothetical protein